MLHENDDLDLGWLAPSEEKIQEIAEGAKNKLAGSDLDDEGRAVFARTSVESTMEVCQKIFQETCADLCGPHGRPMPPQ